MPIRDNPLGDVRVSASTAKLSALSGCGWGLVAYFIGHAAFGHGIWGGIVAAPLIGVLIGHLSESIGAKSRPVQIVASLFDLYLAAMTFWRPGRKWFEGNTPKIAAIAKGAAALPAVAPVIARNFG